MLSQTHLRILQENILVIFLHKMAILTNVLDSVFFFLYTQSFPVNSFSDAVSVMLDSSYSRRVRDVPKAYSDS